MKHTVSSSALAVIDRPIVEQLADADARTYSPALTGIAALTPVPALSAADKLLRDIQALGANDPDPKISAFCRHLLDIVNKADDPIATFGEMYELLDAACELDAFLAVRGIRLIVASGPYGHELAEPLFITEQDGSRYLVVPPGQNPAGTLSYARAAVSNAAGAQSGQR